VLSKANGCNQQESSSKFEQFSFGNGPNLHTATGL